MRETQRRRPQTTRIQLIAVCWTTMAIFDLVFEGLIWMPGGVWQYPGGHWALLFRDTFHKFPLQEMVTASATLTALTCLRYFVNDKGQMLSERGIEEVRGGKNGRIGLRVLATVALVHGAFFACYTLPNTFLGMHSTAWPADHQKRSYLTNGICGDRTDRACPGPGIPLVRNDNRQRGHTSAYVSPRGTVVFRDRTERPRLVPFDRGKPGGDR